jgi:hypothetical protein
VNLRERGDCTVVEGAEMMCDNRPWKNMQLFGGNFFVECKITWYICENFL